jgi:DNA-binding NtrC family response regulator
VAVFDEMSPRDLELEIRPGGKVAPVRAAIHRALTTVGSDARADIAVAGLPPRWAMLQRDGDAVVIRLLASGESRRLVPGETLRLADVELALNLVESGPPREEALPLQGLTDRLSDVDDPREALALLLQELIVATGADLGAVILREQGDYTVAVDQHRDGSRLPQSGGLLSDHIVREVLHSGEQVAVDDVRHVPRYARIPSLTLLQLRAVLCVPMRLHSAVLGAIFLGRSSGAPFGPRQASELGTVAALAVPLLVQMRRIEGRVLPGTTDALIEPSDLLVGESEGMQAVRSLIARVAPSDLSVLILGETGTGKELVARALHQASPRGSHPLIALNCAAVPESLLEAELFGARRGAFTGAVADRVGRIEQAHRSTLFLDELGDMPLPMQAALLRVLEHREVTRLGENVPRPVDFRLIAATHTDLDGAVATGRFRQDLLYRLKEFVIELPPLADRGGDILLLAQLFLRQTEQQLGLSGHRIGTAAAEALMQHRWPGNVRELRATMRRAAILCDVREVGVAHLGLGLAREPELSRGHRTEGAQPELGDLDRPLVEARDAFVARYVAAVLDRHDGDREHAARSLGVSVRSLYRYLRPTAD